MSSSSNFPPRYNATQLIEDHAARMDAKPYRNYEDALMGDAIESHRAQRAGRLTLQQIQDSQKDTAKEQSANWLGHKVTAFAWLDATFKLAGCFGAAYF